MKLELVREWVAKAEEDYATLEILGRQRARRVPDSVCFHAHQCAEKYLKALLVSHGCPIPKTHDLAQLAGLLKSHEPTVELIVDLCHRLNPYAVEFRYPGERATQREAVWTANASREIRRFVRARLNL